jgi:hypothetical protein
VIYVGIDDTDTLDTPGTNQLAREIVRRLAGWFRCELILRHQLLVDPRVPYTSHNGSASMTLTAVQGGEREQLDELISAIRTAMRAWFVEGSDPGFCVGIETPPAIAEFGRTCQTELVSQQAARDLARRNGLHLEGIGGTEGGVIGALAAIGLAGSGNDGRVVQIGQWPDDLSGPQELTVLQHRGVHVRRMNDGEPIMAGRVDVGKHLRPNRREGRFVLFVVPETVNDTHQWRAVRLP